MALDGQLSDFNLAEILQLIASQKKSGFLTLETRPEMVFVFDKGTLISTRDRRSDGPDHLERFLRHYGFFNETQWRHIEYIKNNSSLDLTEILISEQFLDQENLLRALRSVAQEMTYEGMKLKHGRYQFTASRSTPQGIRGHISLEVQHLLMEAARRLDVEPLLDEMFPEPTISFARGSKSPRADELTAGDLHLLKLALSGLPLGKIVRLGQVDSITARERLKLFCEVGYLESLAPGQEPSTPPAEGQEKPEPDRQRGLRAPVLTVLALLALMGAAYLRWQPLLQSELPWWGLDEKTATSIGPTTWSVLPQAASAAAAPAYQVPARALRLRQLQAEILTAVDLFHYRHGKYPIDLSLLVKEGMLANTTYATLIDQGWTYQLLDSGQAYSLAT